MKWTITITSLCFVIVQLDAALVNIGIVKIGLSLNADVSTLRWVVDAYLLAFASVLPIAGEIGDRLGFRTAFLLGFGIFAAASLGCALGGGAAPLITCRTIQGLGAALAFPSSLALINQACAGDEQARIRALGAWSAAGGAATALGPAVGGFLIDLVGWQSIFLINLPISLAAIPLALRHVEPGRPDPRRERADPLLHALSAAVLLTAFLCLIGVSERRGFVWCATCAAVLIALVLLRWARSRTAPSARMPDRLTHRRVFLACMGMGFLNNFAYYGFIFVFGVFMQKERLMSATETGVFFIPLLTASATNLVAGRYSGVVGARAAMASGFLLASFGYLFLIVVSADTQAAVFVVALAVIACGLGLAIPPLTSVLLATAAEGRGATVSAKLTAVRQGGSAAGVALLSQFVGDHTGLAGFHGAMIVCVGAGVLAAGLSAFS